MDLQEAANILLANAELGPDPRMKGATDCYLVPTDDIATLRTFINNTDSRMKRSLQRAVEILKEVWSCQDRDCEECPMELCNGRAFMRTCEKE
jgi:hypothetical protein